MSKQTNFMHHTFELWQMKMVSAYEKWIKRYSSQYTSLTLLRPDFRLSIDNEIRSTFSDVKGLCIFFPFINAY